jgi:pentose-5-phosphate-3-epimerase
MVILDAFADVGNEMLGSVSGLNIPLSPSTSYKVMEDVSAAEEIVMVISLSASYPSIGSQTLPSSTLSHMKTVRATCAEVSSGWLFQCVPIETDGGSTVTAQEAEVPAQITPLFEELLTLGVGLHEFFAFTV